MFKELDMILKTNKLAIGDIEWVGTSKHTIPLDDFYKVIKGIYYDQQSGSLEVARDLIIVGSGWFLRRFRGRNNLEQWEFIKTPNKPEIERIDITKFTIRECLDVDGYRKHNGYVCLEDLNSMDELEIPETLTPQVN